jgi:hypothetical protein
MRLGQHLLVAALRHSLHAGAKLAFEVSPTCQFSCLWCVLVYADDGGCCLGMLPLWCHCRYKIEQELGTEIKPIPPHIEEKLYCM